MLQSYFTKLYRTKINSLLIVVNSLLIVVFKQLIVVEIPLYES